MIFTPRKSLRYEKQSAKDPAQPTKGNLQRSAVINLPESRGRHKVMDFKKAAHEIRTYQSFLNTPLLAATDSVVQRNKMRQGMYYGTTTLEKETLPMMEEQAIQRMIGGGIAVNTVDNDGQTYVGSALMKTKITNQFKAWQQRWTKKENYQDEATGYVRGDYTNPYYVTYAEYQEIEEWWKAKNKTSPYGHQFVVTTSHSQGNQPGNVRDLIAAPKGQPPGGKMHFNFHVRYKN
jgi:hypothetical protein